VELPEGWKVTRLEQAKKLKQPLGLPDLDAGEYLVQALFEVGPVEYHATGEAIPVTWQTIAAYKYTAESDLEPWECRVIIAMSRAYQEGKAAGDDIFCKPPHLWDEDDEGDEDEDDE